MNAADLSNYITSNIGQDIAVHSEMGVDCLTLYSNKDNLQELLLFLRDDNQCLFKQLTDICGADYPNREDRFDVIYHLLSFKYNIRIRIKISLHDGESIPSITSLYNAASWYEREIWDMYGIIFDDHPDLRRLLSDYGFSGHPLRKDFPLTGYVEVRYDNDKQKVVYEPVKLDQEFRNFDFLSPWEGTKYKLPGDEKAS